jgi:hypothetical protein
VDLLAAPRTPLKVVLAAFVAAAAFALADAPQAHAAACTTSWTGTNGNWNEPLNWDNGVPDANDVACIQTADDKQIVISAQTGNTGNATATAKELHLGAPGTGVGTQTILISGETVAATEHLASLTLVGGAGSASDITANGQIMMQRGSGGNASICAGSPLTSNGEIQTLGGLAPPRVLGGNIKNQGTLLLNADATVPSVQTCGANSLENNGGTITIGNSRELEILGSFLQSGGTTNLGADGHMTSTGSLGMTGGSFAGSEAPVVSGGSLSPAGGTGTFSVQGTGTLASGVGPNVTVAVAPLGDNIVLTTSVPATNQGTINLTSIGGGGSFLRATGGTLTNTGTIATIPGAGGLRRIGGTIDNQGMFSVQTSNTASELGANALHLTTSGTLDVIGGSFAIPELTQTGGTVTVHGILGQDGA